MAKKNEKSIRKKIGLLMLLVLLGVYTLVTTRVPSNYKNWEYGFEKLANISFNNSAIKIKNERDIVLQRNSASYTYLENLINPSEVTKAWLVYEPFSVGLLPGFHGIAHTYFIFDFKNSPPLSVSVEARREKGEKYSAELGLFNAYELVYMWTTERDSTIQRGALRNNELYMFPLQITPIQAKGLLQQLAKDSQYLESHPKFYNSLFSNCTNELAKSVNRSKPGTIPLNIALFFPGYSDRELYKLGFIPHDKSFEEIKKHYYISDLVRKIYKDPNFSNLLRESLQKNTKS